MDPENELNSLGEWEAVLEHWKLPFPGIFRSLEGYMREPSWPVFNLVFYFCVFYLCRELTGLIGWIQLEEKASFSVFEGLREYSCFYQTTALLWPSYSGTQRTQLITAAHVYYLRDCHSVQPRLGKVWRQKCIRPWCGSLKDSTHPAPLGLLSYVHLVHQIMYIREDSIKDSLPLTRAAPS